MRSAPYCLLINLKRRMRACAAKTRGESLREIPFSHGPFLRHNGARERSIIQFIDLLSHWLSLRVIRGTDSSGKQFLDV
jgi:hypothetical protein